MDNIKYRKDIDALRGVSVLLVVLYHAFPEAIPGGFIGVDVFFVISGYLITTIIFSQLKNNNFSFQRFYERRVRRIFPTLFTVLLVSLAAGWLILFPDEYKQLGQHASRATIFLQNFNLIHEMGYFDVSSHYKPLLHLWTLSIEEQYYLFWPVILFLIFKFNRPAIRYTIVIIAISFAANIYFVADYKDEVFFHSMTRFWEIGLGSLLAILLQKSPLLCKNKYLNSKLLFITGLCMILFTAFNVRNDTLYPSWIGLLPTIGAVLIILANIDLPNWGGLVKIGLISYPLYMWHWVIISFCYIYIGHKPSTNILCVAVGLSFLFSFLTYKYVEKVRHIESHKIVILLIFIAISVGLFGLSIKEMNGLADRSHLAYLKESNVQFKRTPMHDQQCEACIDSIIEERRAFNYCRAQIDANNTKKILLLGDSHAHVLFPGIADIAKTHGYNTLLMANSSCPPLLNFLWGRNPKEIDHCQYKIKQMIKIIKQDKEIEKIVFVTRGPAYVNGSIKGKITEESIRKRFKKIATPGDRMTYEAYFNGFENTLIELDQIDHVKNVYYVLENPELDFLPKEVIRRPFDYWGLSTQDSSVDRDLYRLRMKKYRDMAFESSSLFPKVSIIDVEDYFCNGDRCFAYKNGNFLYADDDHLSVYGSHYIAEKTEMIIFGKQQDSVQKQAVNQSSNQHVASKKL